MLLTRPEFGRGISLLPANTIPHWSADYRLQVDGQARRIRVYFVEAPLGGPAQWERASCTLRTILVSPDGVYYYQESDDWSLLIAPASSPGESLPEVAGRAATEPLPADEPLPGDEPLPVPCTFTDRFVTRFLFFRSVARPPGPSASVRTPEFPAILTATR